jgi:hypothetical protein
VLLSYGGDRELVANAAAESVHKWTLGKEEVMQTAGWNLGQF